MFKDKFIIIIIIKDKLHQLQILCQALLIIAVNLPAGFRVPKLIKLNSFNGFNKVKLGFQHP